MHAGNVEVADPCCHIRVIGRTIDIQEQRGATTVERGELERIVDRLTPGRAARTGHDGCDHVHELRNAGDAHPIRTADEGVQDAAHLKHILEIVHVLQDRRPILPILALQVELILLSGVIPDVPFVERDRHILLRPLLALHEVDHAAHRADIAIQLFRQSKEVRRVLLVVLEIHVQRNVVDIVVGLLEHRGLPLRVGRHVGVGRSADHQFEIAVEGPQRFGRFIGKLAVLAGRLVADLPGPVHLVPQTPGFHRPRLCPPVLATQVRPVAAAGVVHVFDEAPGLVETA